MLHGYWLRQLGITGEYGMRDIAPDDLPAFFAGFGAAGYVGCNVTVPHKLAVMKHLAEIDAAAQAIGAVNTIWTDNGDLVGGNTDAAGFVDNLDDRAPGWNNEAGHAVVLGAGGAARAAIHGLLGRGLRVSVVNRTLESAEALARHFGPSVRAHGMEQGAALLGEADLLVNTTSLGMVGKEALNLDITGLKPAAVVYDIVYVPLETDLLKRARRRGHRTVDGLGMLLHQAVPGFQHWFGVRPAVSDELRALIEADIRATSPGA